MERPALSVQRARSLRREVTEPERHLWHKLRDRRLADYKIVRQHPIGPFFADFCYREGKIVIEFDGSQHAESILDARRDAWLLTKGYKVLRFWKHDVTADIDGVCETILAAIDRRLEPYERFKTKA